MRGVVHGDRDALRLAAERRSRDVVTMEHGSLGPMFSAEGRIAFPTRKNPMRFSVGDTGRADLESPTLAAEVTRPQASPDRPSRKGVRGSRRNRNPTLRLRRTNRRRRPS
ncbi:hypothetical protein GCM10027174_23120 [Salinifilum aidingensis]